MTSSSVADVMGRTWFDPRPVARLALPCKAYIGVRVPYSALRPNAMTLWDFKPDVNSNSIRSLLRVYSKIAHGILGNPKTAENARAYVEWCPSEEPHMPPSCMWMHLLVDPVDEQLDIAASCRDCLDAIIAMDVKQFRRMATVPGKANPSGQQWAESDMLLAPDQWAALSSAYTGEYSGMLPGANTMHCCPSDVFGPSRAGLGDRWDESTGSLRLLDTSVPMRRCDFEARILFRKYLPWYQCLQLNIPYRLEKVDPEESRMLLRQATAIPNGSVENRTSVWEKLMRRSEELRAKNIDNYERWAVNEVAHGMDGPQGCYVPGCERVINEYDMKPFLTTPSPDGSLSPFATWVSHFMMQAECYGWVYKQHLLLLMLFLGGMDCYREATAGSIHFSVILAGPPSASKSFCFTLLERLLITGTVEAATRRTENSFTYSDDQGSRIVVDHELSKDFFGDVQCRRMGGTARTSQTKEILTSHKATVESCMVDDVGKRVKVRSESRAQLAYFAATNDWSSGGGCDVALVSRFYVVFPTLGKVNNKPLADLMQHDKNPSSHDRSGFEDMQSWCRNTQKIVYWIMKLIHIEGIPDVDLTAVNMVIAQFTRAWGGSPNPRAYERIILIARVCCIVTAVHQHYCAPDAPRAGEKPTVHHVQEMVPLMVVTAEQAKFCLALMRSEFTNPAEHAIIKALRKCNLVPDMDNGGPNYLVPANVDSNKGLIEEIMMHCNSDVTPDAVQQFITVKKEKKIKSKPFVRSPMAQFSVARCEELPEKFFYAMRNHGLHASLIIDMDDGSKNIEDALQNSCNIGPPGREITGNVIDGYPHLLHVRDNPTFSKPFVRDCLFLPKAAFDILGTKSDGCTTQDHRRRPKQIVDVPVELEAFAERGGGPPARGGGAMRYPDDYVNQVKEEREPFSRVGGVLHDEQYNDLKRKLPGDCFVSRKR